jgi:hypothetical protein
MSENMEYKYIEGFKKRYKIYANGQVFNNDHALEQYLDGGYYFVNLSNNGSVMKLFVNELLAKHFMGKKNEDELLVHIDGDSKNNNLNNLKYCNFSEHDSANYTTRIKPIFQFNLEYNFIKKWDTVHHIVKANENYKIGSLSSHLSGASKSYRGFIWSHDRGLTKPIVKIISIIDSNYFLEQDVYDYPELTKEYWKDIVGYETNYKISTFGNIYSKSLNQLFSMGESSHDYNTVELYDKDKNRDRYFVHVLVAQHFIKKPIKDPNDTGAKEPNRVDHIDSNKKNNNITNLRWVTLSENSLAHNASKPKKAIIQYTVKDGIIKEWSSIVEILESDKKYNRTTLQSAINGNMYSAYGHRWRYKVPPVKKEKDVTIKQGEVFMNIGIFKGKDFSKYNVSNCGKVQTVETKLILSPGLSTCGYHVVSLSYDVIIDGEKVTLQSMQKVHRLVAFKFCPNADVSLNDKVNHIDENKLNNHFSNLEWTTHIGNVTHSCGKKINQINLKTEEVLKTFDSIAEAARAMNVTSTSAIRGVISERKKSAYGYKWAYAIDKDNPKLNPKKKKEIVQSDVKT